MRLSALTFVMILATAPAALAAPTCNDQIGRTVRCATPGAMPVGWQPPPEVLANRRALLPGGPSGQDLFALACLLGGLLALFALLPDFEDRKGGGWDRQESDDI